MEVIMLVLERKDGESILVYPSPNIDPVLTVRELFSQPVKVMMVD
jgi:hypothetical protein